MSAKLPTSVQNLIDSFSRLPGIGPKMASRLTFYLLQKSDYDVVRFINALDAVRTGLRDCVECGNITEQELCGICRDENRSRDILCVVEGPLDIIALEKTGAYSGMYHVLGGALSPIDGIGPDQLRMKLLVGRAEKRVGEGKTTEIIIATNPSLEGEATAAYIFQVMHPYIEQGKIMVSRIARGLPMGSDVEYADPTTLLRAMEGRKEVQ